eukprot:scaffold469_cov142-Isochrysis_galbana.AAC.1
MPRAWGTMSPILNFLRGAGIAPTPACGSNGFILLAARRRCPQYRSKITASGMRINKAAPAEIPAMPAT